MPTSTSFRFEDGSLLVTQRSETIAMTGWPKPVAERRKGRGKGEECRPDFRLIYPTGQEPAPALADFRATLPPEVAGVLEPFASHQWNLLELLAARPEALQLASHNPVLAYLLANNDHFRRNLTKPPSYLAQWRLDYNQERLLEWLGFPARTAVVRIVRKIRAESIQLHTARLLRGVLQTDPSVLPMLSHLKRINRGVLGLMVMGHLRPYLTPKLLKEVSELSDGRLEDDPGEKLAILLSENAAGKLELVIPPLRSLRQLDQLVGTDLPAARLARQAQSDADRLAEQARRLELEVERLARIERAALAEEARRNARQAARPPAQPTRRSRAFYEMFPPPPDTDHIVRLRTKADAMEEGQQQHNCVASYGDRVASGRVQIYRVKQPERATMELYLNPHNRWEIAQLVKQYNAPVSEVTWGVMRKWLGEYNLELIRRRSELFNRSVPRGKSSEDEPPF